MSGLSTEILSADPAGFDRAARYLRDGARVAFPTETVYGLGADARNGRAVAGIYAAKGRPDFNPLIVHVANAEMAARYVVWSDQADALAGAFWPGPLTLVLPLRDAHGIAPIVTAGLPTLAIRVPAGSVSQALLAAFKGPVAAPSANPSGRISPTTAAHVQAGLGGRIEAIVDGGPCDIGLESTIVGLTQGDAVLLRPGGLPAEAVADCLGEPLEALEVGPADAPLNAAVTAPGQLASHYAPAARVRLDATDVQGDEVMLGFGPVAGDLSLSDRGDLVEAAARLFGHLHTLEATGKPIAVAPIPDRGLGRAINDRLRRAAAPRD